MSIEKINSFPINLMSHHLQFWENKFHPIINNEIYNITITINKTNWLFLFKIEEISENFPEIENIKTYLKTDKFIEINETLELLSIKIQNNNKYKLNNWENKKIKVKNSNQLMEAITKYSQVKSKYDNAKDNSEKWFLSIELFEAFEELEFLGLATPTDYETFFKSVEIFSVQIYDFLDKVKVYKNSIISLRMLNKYLEKKENIEEHIEKNIFETYFEIFEKIQKYEHRTIEGFHNFSKNLFNLSEKIKTKIKLSNEILSKIKQLHEKIKVNYNNYLIESQDRYQKILDRDYTLINIERKYYEKRKEFWISENEFPKNHNQPYTKSDFKEILLELSSLCEWKWEQTFNPKLWTDLIVDLSIKFERTSSAIIEIFNFCFSKNPFRSDSIEYVKDDKNYTMKMLEIRNELWLDNYWKSNQWFIEKYKEKIKSWHWREKSLLENIEILQKMS